MGESSKARELYDALRALEAKAKAACQRAGKRYSRRAVARAVGGHDSRVDRRLAEWLHRDWNSAKTPDPSSCEQLLAVVQVWSQWADVPCDPRWWSTLLDDAQPLRSPLTPVRPSPQEDRGYAAWIEQHFLPAQLLDRNSELRELNAFCTGPDSPDASAYGWWQAPPWAGKSALVSDFVLRHRPDGVEIVSCFVTDRLGRNDRQYFLETVMRQLAAIAQRDAGTVGTHPEDFPDLYRAAAGACQGQGRRLVLVVDGLDEDQGPATGRPSIAALLPKIPPAGMRVLVTGRPNPPVPDDVPDDHPLRAPAIIRTLDPWSHATGISAFARHELRRLLDDENVGVPLLGLMVAARGSFTTAELAQLVGVRPYRVAQLLRGITGRSFIPGSHGQVLVPDPPAVSHVHALGHEELRREALTALGDITAFENQLHEWADSYHAWEWPPDTPSYLLYDYPRMLHGAGDIQRLTAIALDPHRQRALLERASLDTAFSHIELTAQAVRRQHPDDVVELAALAASSAMLAERARAMPVGVPMAFARLGHARRAMDLALVAPFPAERAVCLAKVARVLAEVGDRHTAEVASEAARWAEQARWEREPSGEDEQEVEEAIGEAAVTLIAVGELRQGCELLGALGASAAAGDEAGATVVARAALAARAHDPALARRLLKQAERYAKELAEGSPADPSAPVSAWGAVAAAAEGLQADRMYERISQYVQAFPPRLMGSFVRASAASALAAVRPEQASILAEQAARCLHRALDDPDALSPEDGADLKLFLGLILTAVVQALADTGSVDRARDLVDCVPAERHTGWMGTDTLVGARAVLADVLDEPNEDPPAQTLAQQAYRLADQGEHDEAGRRLSRALETLGSPQHTSARYQGPWLIPLVTALAAIGQHSDSALLARSLRDPAEQVLALAAAAVSTASAGHLGEARFLAHEAADRAQTLEDADLFGWEVFDAIGAAAQALAHVGERDRALALAEETGPPDHNRRQRTFVAVAAALRSYDLPTAVDLIDRRRERLMTMDASPLGWSGRMADLAELFAALADTDAECAERLHQAAEHVAFMLKETKAWRNTEDLLTMLLLHAREERDDARSTLMAWEKRWASSSPWGLPTGAIAVAHAAFGNLDTARQHANRHNVPYSRAEVLAAVAGYLTRTPSGLRIASASTSTAFTETFRSLALAQFPPGTANAAQAARQFTASALAGDGWHHALPALARIAPAAVERVRDIVFTHRRLPLPSG